MDDYVFEEDFDFYHNGVLVAFYKVSEDNKILRNQKYQLITPDGKETGLFIKANESGMYYYGIGSAYTDEMHFAKADEVLPGFLIEELKSIDTFEKAMAFGTDNTNIHITAHSDSSTNGYVNYDFKLPYLVRNEESEIGYKKSDVVLYASISIRFNFDSSGNVSYKYLYFILNNDMFGFEYEKNFEYLHSMEDYNRKEFINVTSNKACVNSNAGMIITDMNECTGYVSYSSSSYMVVPYFVDEKGEVKFEISNTVNNLAKYNASKDRNLEYKIVVKNIGDVASGDNVITTNVPKGVILGATSISDNGVYDKNENTITWEVERMEAGEELTFTYTATAPEEADGKELVGNSYVMSSQVLSATYSTNTIVTLDKIVEIITNPETGKGMVYIANTNIGMPVSMLVISSIIICMLAVLLLLKMHDEE